MVFINQKLRFLPKISQRSLIFWLFGRKTNFTNFNQKIILFPHYVICKFCSAFCPPSAAWNEHKISSWSICIKRCGFWYIGKWLPTEISGRIGKWSWRRFLGGSKLLSKIWPPKYFFKRRASYHCKSASIRAVF